MDFILEHTIFVFDLKTWIALIALVVLIVIYAVSVHKKKKIERALEDQSEEMTGNETDNENEII